MNVQGLGRKLIQDIARQSASTFGSVARDEFTSIEAALLQGENKTSKMLILAIDTSGQSGGITLAQADAGSFRVIESAAIAGGTFSAQLIPTLAALLKKHGYGVKDLGGFAAASGPGSFTGLRVGLSAIKGLAETLHKPIATVSVLEALASLAEGEGKIAAAIDAGRKEVFLGLYQKNGDASAEKSALQRSPQFDHTLIKLREELLTQQDFLATLATERPGAIMTSHPALAELASSSHSAVVVVTAPGSEVIARIGAGKLLAGETVSVEALDANYLRRSDAEIFFKGKR
jgi:tRNA threonylcarbamoyladenosine biosynthesis protein TsaB